MGLRAGPRFTLNFKARRENADGVCVFVCVCEREREKERSWRLSRLGVRVLELGFGDWGVGLRGRGLAIRVRV